MPISNQDVVACLNNVAIHCRDNIEGYRTAAGDTHDYQLQQEFRRLADERTGWCDRLDSLVRQYGGEPSSGSGTTMGAGFRRYMDPEWALASDDRQAVLEEVARGEGVFEAIYDSVLRRDLPGDVRSEAETQHREVRETRDRFRAQAGMSGRFIAEKAAAGVNSMIQERPILSGALMTFMLGVAIGALFLAMSGGRQHESGQRRYQY